MLAFAEDESVIDPAEARRLLDAGQNDRLLSLVSAEECGLAWCRYATRDWEVEEGHLDWGADPDGWAAELCHEREFWANEEYVRSFLVTIADTAPEPILGLVGAGPLWEFLNSDDDPNWLDDPERIGWVEAQATRSERFRRALGSAKIADDASQEAIARLDAAAGVELGRITASRIISSDVPSPSSESDSV